MKFYLGTQMPHWLAIESEAVPLFVSHMRLRRNVNMPEAVTEWALDSGGFSEIAKHGTWTISPSEYVSCVRRYRDEIGMMAWAAPQDWMCEPSMLAKSGLTVSDHQRLTIDNYLTLRNLDAELPFIPVIQGWEPDDYRRHADEYVRRGVDLVAEPTVGVGSICRRTRALPIAEVVHELAGTGMRLHGFGVKKTGLKLVAPALTSADSMAWSFAARYSPPMAGHPHKNCGSCRVYALNWRQKVVDLVRKAEGVRKPVTEPRILDLFCGAGGAAVGYQRAGFEVVGVDHCPQPNYPFDFYQGDALTVLRTKDLSAFSAIHASPPCQAYSWATPAGSKGNHYKLIPEIREALIATGLPYVIENVEGANRDMPGSVRVCGSSFGMDLRRHRLFETNWPLVAPPCNHEWQTPRFRSMDHKQETLASVVGVHGEVMFDGEFDLWREAMGIDWMEHYELVEAIPPKYTEFVGSQLAGFLRAGAQLSTLPVGRLTKPCNKCGEVKQLHRYSKDRRNSDGRSGQCKECKFGPAPHEVV